MRVVRLALLNVAAFGRRFVGLVVLAVLGLALTMPLMAVASQADDAAQHRVAEGVSLRSIEVRPQPQTPGGARLTPDKVQELKALDKVAAVEPTFQATIGIKTKTVQGALLHATKLRPSQSPPMVSAVRTPLFPLQNDEIVLPASAQGLNLSGLLGQKVPVDYQQTTGPGVGRGAQTTSKVVGLYDATWQLEGADAAFASDSQLLTWASAAAGVPRGAFLQSQGYGKATVVATSAAAVDEVLVALQRRGYEATSLKQQIVALPPVLHLVQVVGRVLLVALVILLALGGAIVSGSLVRSRTREIGLLKAVGFRDWEVLTMFLLELLTVSLLAVLIGAAAGLAVTVAGLQRLAAYPDLAPFVDASRLPGVTVILPLAVVTIVATLAGGLLPVRRGARMEASLALRDW